MSDASLMIYVTKSCPFCDEFLASEAPSLFTWLVESTISYELVEASRTFLKEIGVRVVPCMIYNNTLIDPTLIRFTKDEIVRVISTPKEPTFSGIPSVRD
jgi:hypothetical protein